MLKLSAWIADGNPLADRLVERMTDPEDKNT